MDDAAFQILMDVRFDLPPGKTVELVTRLSSYSLHQIYQQLKRTLLMINYNS